MRVRLARDGRAELRVHGEVDADTVGIVMAAIDGVLARGCCGLRLDMRRVTFVSCSALQALVDARQRCLDANGWLVLGSVPARLSRLLQLTGLRNLESGSAETGDAPGKAQGVPDLTDSC